MLLHLCVAMAIPLLLAAAATDLSVRMVPNTVCLALAFDGGLIAALEHDLPRSLLAALCVFVPAVMCWRHGFIGGGDAKLLPAVSLLVPAGFVVPLVLTIAIIGGALGLVYWTMKRMAGPSNMPPRKHTFHRVLRAEHYRIRRGFSLPYAVAISGGTLLVLGNRIAF